MALLAAASLLIYLLSRKTVFALLALGLLVLGLVFKKTSARLAEALLGFSEVIGNFNCVVVP